MGSIPTIGSRNKPRISGLRGIFIGAALIRAFLRKATALFLALLLSASVLLTCFSSESFADGSYPYKFSGTAFLRGYGHSIGNFETGILKLGTPDSKKGLQTLSISLSMIDQSVTGSLQYRVYVNRKGWQEWTDNGRITGMTTMPELITGVEMRLTGALADKYSIWYSARTDRHKNNQGWVCDGAEAGSHAEGLMIEELRVMLVTRNMIQGVTSISFRSCMQKYGWDKTWTYSNHVAGRAGKGKRFEGLELAVTGNEYTGGVRYRCRLAGSGWQNWVSNGEFCGRRSAKFEAIEIELTGEVAKHYDIYYRTYSAGLGWFAWAKNGVYSGTGNIGRHIEAIQISLVRKGSSEPGAVNKIRSTIGYNYVSTATSTGVSDWRIGTPGKGSFASYVLKRAKFYNMTEYKDMRCDALVAQVLTDALGTDLGKRKGAKYARLNEWIGLSALEELLSSNFTYKDSNGRLIICSPVAQTKLKRLVKKTWNKKEVKITEEEFNTWIKNNCIPGDIIIFYNKNKKPIHCGIYSGVQQTSAKEYTYYHGKKKGEKDTDLKPGHYMWHSGYDTGVANKYAFWVAEVGRSYYIKRYRVDSGKSQPAPPRQ